eukprot:NODE_29_length_37665_cov_1.081563.p19 type:complete len:213 gc:universal NODE_29_length_37665_cov_1.081563:2120-1482(-)
MSSGYDFSVSTYAPDGQIFQIEYAKKAIENAPLTLGIKCKDGIVLGHMHLIQNQLVKYTSKSKVYGRNGLIDGTSISTTISQVRPISKNAIMSWSGIYADGLAMLADAKSIADNHKERYGIDAHGRALVDQMLFSTHQYITYSHLRPYGCTSLIATEDYLGMLEPDATCYGYRAIACGKGNNLAMTELEKISSSESSCDVTVNDAIKLVAEM